MKTILEANKAKSKVQVEKAENKRLNSREKHRTSGEQAGNKLCTSREKQENGREIEQF